ncbi:hypothetical protein [Streptomyces sp. NPDC057623]|uniref:hypothetical protein n=1 Tax=Streptomyces sp. NPDC057623 TaxID=3346187 RepID=UPI00368264E4
MEAVRAAVERFGRSDVLVNDAANRCLGYFEELSPRTAHHAPLWTALAEMG